MKFGSHTAFATFFSARGHVSRPALCRLVVLALSTMMLMASDVVTAQPPDDPLLPPVHPVVTLPTTSASASGFRADVFVSQRQLAGTVPIRIVVRSTSTFAADRQLTFRFASAAWGQSPPTNGLQVDVPVELSQGTQVATVTRYLPKWSAGDAYELSIREQGRVLPDCLAEVGNRQTRTVRSNGFTNRLMSELMLDWVFVAEADRVTISELPDLRSLFLVREGLFGLASETKSPSEDAGGWETLLQNEHSTVAGQTQLPRDWRAYQTADLIVISRDAVRAAKSNGRFEAIHDWVLNGGSIAIYDAGSLENLVGDLQVSKVPDPRLEKKLIQSINFTRGEIEFYKGDFSNQLDALRQRVVTSMSTPAQFVDDTRTQIERTESQLRALASIDIPSVTEMQDRIWVRPLGAGLVIGMSAPATGELPDLEYWKVVYRTLSHRISPTLRRGADPILGDTRFRRWVIPGVAEPPVYTFIGLLAVFVILVGPVAYRYTARRERGYLMFLIAPVLAIVTTIAMFAYGVVSDGFGTTARIRQLTWIDAASGCAGERTQATYFAGLRPGDGMRFNASAEVIRYLDGSGVSWEDLESRRAETIGRIRLTELDQLFDSAFLPSRQQRQFVIHQPRRNVGWIQIDKRPVDKENTSSTATLHVSSQLQFDVQRLVVRDFNGEYWQAMRLPSAADKVECQPLSRTAASKTIGDLYNDFRPIATNTEQGGRRTRRNVTRDLVGDLNESMRAIVDMELTIVDGSFESWLNHYLQMSGELPHGHFVCIADVSEDAIAVTGAELVESVRFVFGTVR